MTKEMIKIDKLEKYLERVMNFYDKWGLAIVYYGLVLLISWALKQDIIHNIQSDGMWLWIIFAFLYLVAIPLMARHFLNKETTLDKIHKI